MEISNPIAAQYIVNQGVASQLNNQVKHLPVKSDRPANELNSRDNRVDPVNEDPLRTEEDSRQQANNLTPVNTEQQDNNGPNQQSGNQFLQTIPRNNLVPVGSNDNNRDTEIQATLNTAENNQNQLSPPVQRYLDTSNIESRTNAASNIDIFV